MEYNPDSPDEESIDASSHQRYAQIKDDVREEIIRQVFVLGKKVKQVAEELKVNASSAKNVIAIYKREGRIEKKKT